MGHKQSTQRRATGDQAAERIMTFLLPHQIAEGAKVIKGRLQAIRTPTRPVAVDDHPQCESCLLSGDDA